MVKKDWLICTGVIVAYLLILFIFKHNVFTYRFDHSLIDRYYLSQDITHEVNGQRLFLSDADIYLATGYLYATGHDPSANNFEHPPLIKYLFGFSILLFHNPFVVQILLGALLLTSFYFLSKKIYGSTGISTLATVLLLIDPLFLDLSSQALLDLGQTLILVLYFLAIFKYKKNFLLQGLFLACFASTKFWIPTFFFVALFAGYKIYKKEMNYGHFMAHLGIAFLIYTLFYTETFILKQGQFNIFWHFLKTVKYRLQHNTSTYLGASLIMYLTSFVKTWWGDHAITSIQPWSPLWPVSLAITIWYAVKNILKKTINEKLIIAVIPLGYLCYLGVQAPFTRYFMPILPFSYLIVAEVILKKFKKIKKEK